MEEMMKPKWSDRVWVGVSKQPLSGARTMPAARSVSSIICRTLEASSKEEHAINRSSTYNSVRIPWRRRAAATTDMTLVQVLGELVPERKCTFHIQAEHVVLGFDDRLEHAKILVGGLTLEFQAICSPLLYFYLRAAISKYRHKKIVTRTLRKRCEYQRKRSKYHHGKTWGVL
jgi:hypothetical protein